MTKRISSDFSGKDFEDPDFQKRYIAFIDIFGFKDIALNNEPSEVNRHIENFKLYIQLAFSLNEFKEEDYGRITPNLANSNLNYILITDRILIWTNDNTVEDFDEIMVFCNKFYRHNKNGLFPFRGCLTYGEFYFNPLSANSQFHRSSFIGKGLVNAYTQGESLEYVGILFDESIQTKVGEDIIDQLLNDGVLVKRTVPFKSGKKNSLVFSPFSSDISKLSFQNLEYDVRRMFTQLSGMDIDNLPESVTRKMINTIEFIEAFVDPNKKGISHI